MQPGVYRRQCGCRSYRHGEQGGLGEYENISHGQGLTGGELDRPLHRVLKEGGGYHNKNLAGLEGGPSRGGGVSEVQSRVLAK